MAYRAYNVWIAREVLLRSRTVCVISLWIGCDGIRDHDDAYKFGLGSCPAEIERVIRVVHLERPSPNAVREGGVRNPWREGTAGLLPQAGQGRLLGRSYIPLLQEPPQGPDLWLLQSSKKNYALWLYYHRLDKDLLFKALVNYVEPKIRLETSRLETLRSQKAAAGESGKEAKRLAKEVERQEDFLSELRDFEDKLRRAANLHLEPDLNDGVVLNIAPLHELVPWKEAKKYWEELLEGQVRVVLHRQATSPERTGEVMAVVTESLVQLIAKQVDEKGLVVWYDPEQAYGAAAAELSIAEHDRGPVRRQLPQTAKRDRSSAQRRHNRLGWSCTCRLNEPKPTAP